MLARLAKVWAPELEREPKEILRGKELGMGTATNFATMLQNLEAARPGDWGYAERRKTEIIKI